MGGVTTTGIVHTGGGGGGTCNYISTLSSIICSMNTQVGGGGDLRRTCTTPTSGYPHILQGEGRMQGETLLHTQHRPLGSGAWYVGLHRPGA